MKMIFVDPETKSITNTPNIGLAYISASLKKDHIIVDQTKRPSPKDRFLPIKSDWFGVSVKLNTYGEAARISSLYHHKYPNSKVVWGGPHASCDYDAIKEENPDVELFVGEWDYAVDLDSLPFPEFTKFDSHEIIAEKWKSGEMHYPLVTSRGCPYSCTYCSSHLVFGKKWRMRSAKNCFEELKQRKKEYGIKSFEILDDSFNIDMERIIEFSHLVKPLKMNWHCANGARADRFDEDMAKAMAEAGCRSISFGVESTAPEVLKAIKKGETIEQIEDAVDVATKYFPSVNGYFIIGLPESSYEKDLDSLKWALNKKINFHFSYLFPFRGTELSKEIYGGRNFGGGIFFGGHSKPISNAYPKDLQRRIYRMTEYMRSINKRNVAQKMLTSAYSIMRYDSASLPLHIKSGVDKVRRRFK